MSYENYGEIREKSSRRNQYFAAAVCTLANLGCGCLMGWVSYSVPVLLAKDQTILTEPITSQEAALVGSINNIGAIIAIPFFGWIYDRFGRQRGGVLLAVPLLISGIITYVAPSANYIIVARLFLGISAGGATTLPPLYTAETAEVSIRGALGSFLSLGFTGGCLFSFILGSFLEYFTLLGVFLCIFVVYAILMWLMPETPVFLMKNGREEEAAKSLAWLRGTHLNSQIVREEIAYLRQQLYGTIELSLPLLTMKPRNNKLTLANSRTFERNQLEAAKTSFTEVTTEKVGRPAWKKLVMDKASRNAFLMAIMLITCHSVSGLHAIQTFAAEIFAASNIELSPNVCAIFYGLALVIGALLCTFLADFAGRKVLMVSTLAGVASLFAIIGFTLQTGYGPSYIPAVMIISSAIIFNCGAGSVPFIAIGEYFDNDVRDLAAGILVQYLCMIIFLAVHFFRAGVEFFGSHGMFYISATNCGIGAIVCYLHQKETKGLKQEDILAMFGREKTSPRATEIDDNDIKNNSLHFYQ